MLIREAVTEETNFLVPTIHCLNKLRGKSRTVQIAWVFVLAKVLSLDGTLSFSQLRSLELAE